MTRESNDQEPDDVWRSLRAPEPDDPWAEVDRRLDGLLAEDRPRRRPDPRRLRHRVLLVVAIIVVGLAAGWFAAITTAGGHHPSTRSTSSVLDTVLVIAGVVVALGAWTVGLVLRVRRQGIWVPTDEPLRSLPRAERQVVGRMIRGRGPVDPMRLRTLRRLAGARLDHSGWAIWFGIGWVGLATSQIATHPSMGWTLLPVLLGVVWATALVVLTVQRRQWRAFLAAHPAAEPVSGS